MSLNNYMHPRNPYKNNRIDFEKLALQDDDFRKVATQTLAGKVMIDFKDPNSLRALCCATLKFDFGLKVILPDGRLIPTVPQRLNYLLWIEDILMSHKTDITGIDIGCGGCCIYPLLGSKRMDWKFFTTEMDPTNLTFALENVSNNQLTHLIKVMKADETLVTQALTEAGGQVDFCMCNPPFFVEGEESPTSRSSDRPESRSISTANEMERACKGGEVSFIKNIIDESLQHTTQIRVYTSLCGKKSSIGPLKRYLRGNGVTNLGVTEFCQGRTMRWGLGWSFHDDVTFPKSLFQEKKQKKASGCGMMFDIPPEIKATLYSLPDIVQFVKKIFDELKIEHITLNQTFTEFVSCCTAKENTWTNSRRKKRQALRESSSPEKKICKSEADQSVMSMSPESTNHILSSEVHHEKQTVSVTIPVKDISSNLSGSEPTEDIKSGVSNFDTVLNTPKLCKSTKDFFIKFSLEIKMVDLDIVVKLKFIEGTNKDTLQQIYQYLKNKLN